MPSLLQWDIDTFLTIHNGLKNGLLDAVMPLWRNGWIWAPFYVFIIAYWTLNFGRRAWIIVLIGALSIGLCDQVSSHLLKPQVERLRPCNEASLQGEVHPLIPCGSGFSFPSTHATNHMCLAIFMIMSWPERLRPKWRWSLFFWALSVGFAQVYVGAHYPIDVLFGALLGAIIGYWFGSLSGFLYRRGQA